MTVSNFPTKPLTVFVKIDFKSWFWCYFSFLELANYPQCAQTSCLRSQDVYTSPTIDSCDRICIDRKSCIERWGCSGEPLQNIGMKSTGIQLFKMPTEIKIGPGSSENGPFKVWCRYHVFFDFGKTEAKFWWSWEVTQKSSDFIFVWNLVNMILYLDALQFSGWSDHKRNNATTFSEKPNEPYFFLGSSSHEKIAH